MLYNIFYDHWQHSWPAAWQAERFTKNLANGILYFSFLSTRHTIMAEREYLPLILFTAILSALCTFARDTIDYQQIVQCRQARKASALRLHPSAPICTDTIPHTPHDKTGVPPAHYGIGGANFLSEQQIFLPPYTFFSDWHKWYDAPGTSTSAEDSADRFRPYLHYFSHW